MGCRRPSALAGARSPAPPRSPRDPAAVSPDVSLRLPLAHSSLGAGLDAWQVAAHRCRRERRLRQAPAAVAGSTHSAWQRARRRATGGARPRQRSSAREGRPGEAHLTRVCSLPCSSTSVRDPSRAPTLAGYAASTVACSPLRACACALAMRGARGGWSEDATGRQPAGAGRPRPRSPAARGCCRRRRWCGGRGSAT